MSDIGDIDGGDIGDGGPDLPVADGAIATAALAGAVCLACGGAITGPFCAACGQKNDDLRRSSFLLARDFIEDTFSFDSRMWRTLGLLAARPGLVPKDYAHGRRSRYTPPVRLFLVVSFLFFLIIGLTKTLFVGLEVTFHDQEDKSGAAVITLDDPALTQQAADPDCGFNAKLRFFVKERDLVTNKERMDACFAKFKTQALENTAEATEAAGKTAEEDDNEAGEVIGRVFGGLEWAVANPREFNDSFNDWLPRVLLLMTPVLALCLVLFIRRKALIFDHLVLAFYTHAVGFAVIGASLILAQVGFPQTGLAAFIALSNYYIAALKRAYGRGWVKTIWTAMGTGMLYMIVLMSIMMTIIVNVVMRAVA
ncbi:MAG: DUF3667 domain-containing protein [Parvularculaceae bacterium]